MSQPTNSMTTVKAASAEEFQWPPPPYFEFVREEDRCGLGECMLVFRDSAMVTGRLRSFVPDDLLLTFQADGAKEVIRIEFSALLKLQLVQPVGLRPEKLPPGLAKTEESQRSERQPFRLELVTGEKFEGVTLGHLRALCGLFLFLEAASGGIVRCFVPAQATTSCNIGAPIGQILVDQNVVSPEAVNVALSLQKMMRTQRLGEYLTENRLVSPEQLAAALDLKRDQPGQRLGEALMELGVLSHPELRLALESGAKERSMPIGEILQKKMGIVDDNAISLAVANKLGIPMVNLAKVKISRDIINKIPAATAHRRRVVPLCEAEGALFVAIENPMDGAVLDELRAITRMTVCPVAASGENISRSLMMHYGALPTAGFAATTASGRKSGGARATRGGGQAAESEAGVQELIARLATEGGNLDAGEQQAIKSDSALVQLVNRIILDAVMQKASDIHIEANLAPKTTRIRLRKDGTLVDYLDLPAPFRNAVVSRIKIMSQLDITERRKPQDGKIDFNRFGPAPVELRVATIPTTRGLEDVVMRVLAAASPVPMEELGVDHHSLDAIKKLISRPHGLFLVCGPTGSGKTTTLHSLLAFLNTPGRKIWTAEDPIEITQPGLRQVQVNGKIGWTFAAAMRSFMRADPDIIMVGEMRDAETAKIGIEASLTGHLLLSTLHTNSAPESITRLLDLGMDPFNFADALLGILALRLARRLCPKCKVGYTPTPAELKALALQYCDETPIDPEKQLATWNKLYAGADGKITLSRASGCMDCDRSGYRGRIGLYELLAADSGVKKLVQTRAPVAQIKSMAIDSGMRTLRQDGIEKIMQGLTDIQQVSAVSV